MTYRHKNYAHTIFISRVSELRIHFRQNYDRNVQSHMLRPTITDMQDKYWGNCYDIYLIQSQYAKAAACARHHKRDGPASGRATSFVVSFVLASNKVNIVAITTILVLHGGNGRSAHVWLDIMFFAIRWDIGNIHRKIWRVITASLTQRLDSP